MEGISGPWMDRRTGKTIIVRDAIQDGDNLIIMTSAGQIPTEIFQNYFVQVSENEYSAASQGISNEVSGTQLLQQINVGLDDGLKIDKASEITLDTPIGSQVSNVKFEPKNKTVSATEAPKLHNNMALIKKVFDKHNIEPTIDFGIDITEWPVEQLKMLINVFDISVEEIAEYVLTNYLNADVLRNNLTQYLDNELNK